MEFPKDGQEDGSTVSENVKASAVVVQQPKPRVTSFVPQNCTACQRLRELDPATEGNSYSRVYSTQGRTRYCKCGYCGHTWKEVE
jgi:hypothetical protein